MSDMSDDDPTPTQDERNSDSNRSPLDLHTPSERVDEDDILDIKPPQAENKKEKRKHKHKSDRKHSRSKSEKDKRRISPSRDKGRSRDRHKDHVRDHRRDKDARPSRDEESAARRRESSKNERERLERLERERHRILREGDRRVRAHKEMLRRTEGSSRDRASERDKAREKERDKSTGSRRKRDEPVSSSWRGAGEKHSRSDSRPARTESRRHDDGGGKHSFRQEERSRSPLHRDMDERVVEMAHDHDERIVRRVDHRLSDGSMKERRHDDDDERDVDLPGDEEDDESSESGSGDSGETEGSESDDEEEEEEEEDGEIDDEEEQEPAKMRSKFESEAESEESEDPSPAEVRVEVESPEASENGDKTPELPVYYPAIQGCRSVEEFQCLNRVEEGTYGVVYRAKDKKTEEIVALKRLKMEKENEGFPITSLREINTLLKAQHPNIVTVREIVVGSNMDKIYIVMDFVEHDMKSLMETMKEPFLAGEVKTLLIQLLRGVAHMHDNWILHRDLKTSNLLLSHQGILKIGDFGLAREYASPLKPYTSIVVTLWYRAPELLLGVKKYSCPIDLWSVGCIFAEFLTRKPLFPGKSEIDQLNRIFKELGTPNEKIWPGVGELPVMKKCTFTNHPYNSLRKRFGSILTDRGFDLMNRQAAVAILAFLSNARFRFLTYNPEKRVTPEEALEHPYFAEAPVPIDPAMFPTWPARSEKSHKKRTRGKSPKPPSAGKAAHAQLLGDDDDELIAKQYTEGFHLTYASSGAASKGPGFSLKF